MRLFSNESGVYGSKLAAATVASGMWENDKPLAEVYLDRMSYAYGYDADTRNVKLEGTNLYSEALRGTKAAVLSRSATPTGVIDDPFQYLGGLGLAVRHLDGKTPELFLSDLRDTRDFKNKTLAEFISVELRAQMFHPRYIKELIRTSVTPARTAWHTTSIIAGAGTSWTRPACGRINGRSFTRFTSRTNTNST